MRLYQCFFASSATCVSMQGAAYDNEKEGLFGLSFELQKVTTSRLSSSGHVEMFRRPVTPEYRTYYDRAVEAWGLEGDNMNEETQIAAQSMLQQMLDSLTRSVTHKKGHQPKYVALFGL